MASSRQFNSAGFLNSTIAPLLQTRSEIDGPPILGIDECLNNEEHIGALVRRLLSCDAISQSVPLWYATRETKSGEKLSVLGNSISPSPLVPDVGRPIRGESWPDEGVIACLISNFIHADRLCLLTQNVKLDVNGLRYIFENEVGPVLEALSPKRLGLLVLAQESPSSGNLGDYARAVESRLTKRPVTPGYNWEQLP
jgi:hypothetical protein